MISYCREWKQNYLILEPDIEMEVGYSCSMLEQNNIPGLLAFSRRMVENRVNFYYEITSKQPLARVLEKKSLQVTELKTLMISICNVLERMHPYLLSEESLWLDPEYLYVDSESYEVWLCMVPEKKENFLKAFGDFLEYLLGKVDHQDKESVVLAYGLFQETRKLNYGMDDILKLVYQLPKEEPKLPIVKEEPVECYQIPKHEEKEIKISFGQQVKNWFSKKSLVEKKSEEAVELPWELLFAEETEPQKETQEEKLVGFETVLLHEGKEHASQRCLLSLQKDREDIPIGYFPFVIGKQENLVDYQLKEEAVSRIHLRLDQVGEEYQITDLNSTNGTMLQDQVLGNNETVSLNLGDEIKIAHFRFRFI